MFCAIWYHLYNLKKREKHPWRNATFNKVIIPPLVFFTFFKLYEWYQIGQTVSDILSICFQYAEMETILGDIDRARAIYELAINQSLLDMPEVCKNNGPFLERCSMGGYL